MVKTHSQKTGDTDQYRAEVAARTTPKNKKEKVQKWGKVGRLSGYNKSKSWIGVSRDYEALKGDGDPDASVGLAEGVIGIVERFPCIECASQAR